MGRNFAQLAVKFVKSAKEIFQEIIEHDLKQSSDVTLLLYSL